MPLVDYDVSDESDQESDNESEVKPTAPEQKQPKAEVIAEKDGLETQPEEALFSSLPKPKTQPLNFGDDNKLHNFLLNKPSSNLKTKEAVKITIPSLSEFAEEEKEKPAPKKFKSSSTSALFSVLPPPKNSTVKEAKRTLIPDSVLKKKTQTQVQPNPSVVKPLKAKVKPVVEPIEDDDKIDHGPSLMFSHDFLTSGNSNSNDSSDAASVVVNKIETEQFDIPDLQQTDWERGDIQVTQFDIIDNPTVHSVDQIPLPPPPELELDDKALEVLMGKKRKREQIPLEVIDIQGKDIMPDSREWLLKQFQEDQPVGPPTSAKGGQFSANSKRKHQITYLAYQAKAQELELKNQWAQNRMTRKQTQQKYGF